MDNTNNIPIKILDGIGFYAPYILFFIIIIYGWNRKVYLSGYVIFFVANTFLNRLLKLTFREPRPSDYQIYDTYFEKTTNGEEFGMPSGHAQSAAFSITFLYLLTRSIPLLITTIFIAALCVYQRWKYRRHTIKQLVSGLFTGSIFGSISYYLITKYLKTKTQIQPQIKI
jgi:membrane-associated phospholipid phosphatase